MSSKDDTGLMSNAGLVRYFDAESSDMLFIDPRTVAAVGMLFGILMIGLNVLF